MPLITIVGAGSGLGIEIARAFGNEGFDVALVARTQSNLDSLVTTLESEGIRARGFTADVSAPATITSALAAIKAELGPIDVLEFSPADRSLAPANVLEVTPENLQPQIDFYIGGALSAVGAVLPDMIAAGAGTVLITTGGGSINPRPAFGTIGIATAGLRNWTLNLHNALRDKGVYVAYVAISALIGAGHPDAEPTVIAKAYVDLYQARQDSELNYVVDDH
ncbi:MAG TPA: SDR family NAD(P)-dependent oxidoreductase [Pedococcus sp.]|jgi:NADP-dependent 3-hydroxy acid dehydrogenase YdfG|nr:SDR family NAD(P)-dependent oxidoreductase [Pedococcus sp.]